MTWPQKRLSELGVWSGGSTPSKAEPSYWLDGTVPWLSPKDMGDDVLRETRDHVTTAALNAGRVKRVPPGSVAVVVRSGILERTVPIAIVPFETTLNQDMKAIVPSSDVDGRWIAWALRSQERQILAQDRKSGTTVASLDSAKFLCRTIPVPPLDEQRRVIEILEDHLSRLDAAEGGLRSATSRLLALENEFTSRAIARAQERAGVSTIGAQATLVQYGSSAKASPHQQANDVPILRMGNIQDGRIDYASLKYLAAEHSDVQKTILQVGDLLFNRTNSAELVGKAAVVTDSKPTVFASYLIRVRFDEATVVPAWASMVINSRFGRAYISGVVSQQVGQANVNGTKLRAFPLPLPELAEQRRLVDEFGELRASTLRTHGTLAAGRTRSASLRRALLTAAFSGNLTGRASDTDRIEELADASHDPR